MAQSIAPWLRVLRLFNSWLQHRSQYGVLSPVLMSPPPLPRRSRGSCLATSCPRPVPRRITRSNAGFCWAATECFTENNLDCPPWRPSFIHHACLMVLINCGRNSCCPHTPKVSIPPSLLPSFPKPEEVFPAAKWPIIILAVCP